MPPVSDLVALKPARTALLLGAIVSYVITCAVMAGVDAAGGLTLLLAAWVLGLGVLMTVDEPVARFGGGTLTMVKALWLNLGMVASSLFVHPELRLLLLAVPLFGVLYAALHLDRRRVAVVAGVTWAGYLLGTLALIGSTGGVQGSIGGVQGSPRGVHGEERLIAAFSVLLVAMYFMAGEVTELRKAFERRRLSLDSAMQKLANLAMRDDLTGLYNRRYVMEVLARQKALADRGHLGFTLCYCDLDHFKRVNDRFGHQRGDDILREFGALAEQVVRSVDFVARFGGEEFLLVLVDADAEEARRVAGRLGERTRNLEIDRRFPGYRLSVSVGIAEFRPGESIEDVIRRADQALYQAKSSGRDLVIVA